MQPIASARPHGSLWKHTGNIHAQLLNMLGAPSVPPPFVHPVPGDHSKRNLASGSAASSVDESPPDVDFPINLPHAIFACYYQHDRERFNALFLGEHTTQAAVRGFWDEMESRRDPRLIGHPMTRRSGWQGQAMPLSLHGDGVQFWGWAKLARSLSTRTACRAFSRRDRR